MCDVIKTKCDVVSKPYRSTKKQNPNKTNQADIYTNRVSNKRNPYQAVSTYVYACLSTNSRKEKRKDPSLLI